MIQARSNILGLCTLLKVKLPYCRHADNAARNDADSTMVGNTTLFSELRVHSASITLLSTIKPASRCCHYVHMSQLTFWPCFRFLCLHFVVLFHCAQRNAQFPDRTLQTADRYSTNRSTTTTHYAPAPLGNRYHFILFLQFNSLNRFRCILMHAYVQFAKQKFDTKQPRSI